MSRLRKRRPRLRFDALENRTLMTVALVNGVVEITGSNSADVFSCIQTNGKLRVAEGVVPAQTVHEFDVASVNRIVAELKGGNDILNCDDAVTIPVQADGGAGFDIIGGGSANDVLSGGSNGDALNGRAGNDTLSGGDGPDVLQGWIGDDHLSGNDQNDSLFGALGNDTIMCGAGIDRAQGNEGDDTIYGESEPDFLRGDEGRDYIHGGEHDNDRIWGGTENDSLHGGSGNDTVLGEQGLDMLYGDLGNDSLDGGADQDTLEGGLNRDTLIGGDARDMLDGGDGPDLLHGDGAASTDPGPDLVRGGEGNDRVHGDGGNDFVWGDDGNDTLLGGEGNDDVRGDRGRDRARGGAGEDRIYGGEHNDILLGEDDDDHLFGEEGTDTLDGGNHNDILVSIDDDTLDVLYGRAGGNDSFWVDKGLLTSDKVKDASAQESETNLHKIASFENDDADKTLDGDGIADPTGGESSFMFVNRPLFPDAGPAVTDITQGDLGDCWFLGTLASAVNVTPNVARQLIVDLGDGTYAVHLMDQVLNTERYYRVDADLPVTLNNPTSPQFAKLGPDNALWVALIEKAVAMDKGNDYQQLNNDTPYFPLGQLGGTNRRLYHVSNGDKALADIAANGWAGVYCSRLNAADVNHVVPSHCYGIIAILIGLQAQPTGVVLYNPHGVDNELLYDAAGNAILDAKGNHKRGSMDGNDDGFITLTMQQFAHDAQDPIGVLTADYNRYL